VVKPFDIDELLARIRALLRRSAGRGEPVFAHKGVSLNPATREALLHGQPVSLSAREWAVLEALIARPGAVLSRAQLEEKLFSWKDDISSNAVEVYVHGVRKKLGNDFIQNVRGLGYVVPKE
jgi:two-component system OmpR family response regulator